ncbi:MAG TPA: CPBP family intramembrane glutamic endopeptidase [Pirellulales bacterium]|nr:CPBP family intramembrane glutamic endopeptidase [Pirellulales bacterium]
MEITPAELIEQVCMLLAMGLPVWLWLVWRWRNDGVLLPYEPRSPVPWQGVDLLLVLALFFLAEVFCLSLGFRIAGLKPAIDGQPQTAAEQLVAITGDGAARLVALCLALVVLTRRAHATAANLGFQPTKIVFDLTCGAIAFAAIAPVVYAVQIVSEAFITQYHHPLIKAVQQHPDPVTWIMVTLSAVIVAPVTEEFFFRGLLQGWLEKIELDYCRRLGRVAATSAAEDYPADAAHEAHTQPQFLQHGLLNLPLGTVPILLSSTLFALTHLGQGAAHIPLFVLALVLGFLYQRTHRLLPSVVVHFLLNAITMGLLFAST